MKAATLKASEFFSVSMRILSETGKIIRTVIESKDLNTKYKGENDPVTIADLKIQNLIKKGIVNLFPGLKIIGEEDNSNYVEEINFDFSSCNKSLIPENSFEPSNNEFEYENSIMWIDPLDGTINFVKGEYDGVTTLIGISHNGKPYLGLVAKYYQKKDDGYEFNPCYYFSIANENKVYTVLESSIDFSQEKINLEILKQYDNEFSENNFVVLCSNNHMTSELEENLKKLNPTKIINVGGCGNKILYVADRSGHLYYYPKAGTSKWDSCAPSSLILSLGGFVTDKDGKEINYIESELSNKTGLIATLNKIVLEKAINNSK